MIKVYKHPKYFYELESVTRFIEVEYVDNINKADFIAIASSVSYTHLTLPTKA